MSSRCRPWPITLLVGIAISLLFVSCEQNQEPAKQTIPEQQTESVTEIPLPTITISPTPTEIIPTPTPEPPSAALVNGQSISLELFNREFERFEAAQESLGKTIIADNIEDQNKVLDALIEQVLIEQASEAEGVTVSDEALDAEIERLVQTTGSQQNFENWLDINKYSLEEFRSILRSQMVAQVMNMRISENIPDTMEQVHASHIVVESVETGNLVLSQLELGMDFATLASEYSLDESTRMNGGDLGFFPRDFLLSPQVEEAAFLMEEGEISGLVESDFGFHIIRVLEKDPARAVPPEVLQRLRLVAFDRWIQELWSTAEVERSI
ncbi:MAG: peptidylprolyl isomerase [Anaerolineales bacterium]|nr:peptidylprolyl isomerase [Anaerolineales bacterium]